MNKCRLKERLLLAEAYIDQLEINGLYDPDTLRAGARWRKVKYTSGDETESPVSCLCVSSPSSKPH